MTTSITPHSTHFARATPTSASAFLGRPTRFLPPADVMCLSPDPCATPFWASDMVYPTSGPAAVAATVTSGSCTQHDTPKSRQLAQFIMYMSAAPPTCCPTHLLHAVCLKM